MAKRDLSKVERGFELVLSGLGLEVDEHTRETAERAAKAWYHELCAGLTGKPPKITTFPSTADQMVLLREIPIKSICAHHLLPFTGTASVAYVPGTGRILGLSKLSRLANYWARRPQVQEVLTEQLADAVAEHVMHPPTKVPAPARGGVGVIIRANHTCMELRGVGHKGDMVTSALRGVLQKPEARDEFFRLAGY